MVKNLTPQQFREIRQSKELSCQKMAEFLGLKDRRTVQRYESGKLEIPRFVEIILTLTGDFKA